jgi:hypothetical protein
MVAYQKIGCCTKNHPSKSPKTPDPKLIQAEGFILSVGARMFTIADPVIVYRVKKIIDV